jgi:hypothetical protein
MDTVTSNIKNILVAPMEDNTITNTTYQAVACQTRNPTLRPVTCRTALRTAFTADSTDLRPNTGRSSYAQLKQLVR